ncbi:MAG: L,D-transpeptidase [Pseudomonadota bacterium]
MSERQIEVSVSRQSLSLVDPATGTPIFSTSIATAKNGTGQLNGSECTPLGRHRIRAKIGSGARANSVFVGRRLTGEILSPDLAKQYPQRDWILTRILWLCGEQPGYNRLGQVDTQRRYVYIHGAPDFHDMGVPSSHGCIKMTNEDVITLFDMVEVGTKVNIEE